MPINQNNNTSELLPLHFSIGPVINRVINCRNYAIFSFQYSMYEMREARGQSADYVNLKKYLFTKFYSTDKKITFVILLC